MASFWAEEQSNSIRTWLLFAFFFALIFGLASFVGWYLGLGGFAITGFAVILAVLMTVGGFYYSDKIVLSSTGARPATKQENAYLVNLVEGLSLAAGLPVPKIYVMDDESINAFATGRDPQHAVVVVTTGALKKLNRQQLEGVVAHELSHVRNRDMRVMMLAAVFAGCVILLADMFLRAGMFGRGGDREGKGGSMLAIIGFVMILLSPIFAQLIKLAISRSREYLADASGAQLTRYPEGLASALDKIRKDTAPPMARASEATAHLFISNPLRASLLGGLFSTHPPLEERIRRLRAM